MSNTKKHHTTDSELKKEFAESMDAEIEKHESESEGGGFRTSSTTTADVDEATFRNLKLTS